MRERARRSVCCRPPVPLIFARCGKSESSVATIMRKGWIPNSLISERSPRLAGSWPVIPGLLYSQSLRDNITIVQ